MSVHDQPIKLSHLGCDGSGGVVLSRARRLPEKHVPLYAEDVDIVIDALKDRPLTSAACLLFVGQYPRAVWSRRIAIARALGLELV